MKKLSPLLFSILFLFSACGNSLKQPEGMSDEQYKKTVQIVEDAQQTIKETTDAFPLQGYLDLGLYSSILLDYQTAEESYLTILETHPDHFVALNNLAVVYEDTGRKQEALEYYSKIADTYPEKYESINDALRLFKELGRKDDGLKVLEHWITEFPKDRKDNRFFQFTSEMYVFLNE